MMKFIALSLSDVVFILLINVKMPTIVSILTFRVGSHVVSVSIHCTEKWQTSFHNDVLSRSK